MLWAIKPKFRLLLINLLHKFKTTMSRLATLLLLFCIAALLFLHLPGMHHAYISQNYAQILKAFFEAAVVGALADWFAVTALFRRPLGLPIPHTAIIPNSKARLGEGLGEFLKENFLSRTALAEKLKNVDIAKLIHDWLTSPEHQRLISNQFIKSGDLFTNLLKTDHISSALEMAARKVLDVANLGGFLKRIITVFLGSERCELIVNQMLDVCGALLEEHEEIVREKVQKETPWFFPQFIDNKISEKVLDGIKNFFKAIKTEKEHPLRKRFLQLLAGALEQLSQGGGSSFGDTLKKEIVQSLGSGKAVQFILSEGETVFAGEHEKKEVQFAVEQVLEAFAKVLGENKEISEGFNLWIKEVIILGFATVKEDLAGYIKETVVGWDETELVEKIEGYVARDLQFIRVNGTIVGGLIGVVLWWLKG